MDDFIDSAIAQAKASEAVQPEQATTPEANQQATEEQKPETPEEKPELSEAEKERKKLENALSYQRKQRAKAQREAQEQRQRLEQLEKELAQFKPKSDNAPKEENYNSYSEYLEAKQEWLLERKLAEREAKAKEATKTAEVDQIRQQQAQALQQKAQEAIKQIPDYLQTMQEHAELIDGFPPHIIEQIHKADNAPLALYNLAKEGKLEELPFMDAIDAAVEIRLAQRTAPTPPKSKAPPPISAARGAASASKTLERMTPDEIGKWLNS